MSFNIKELKFMVALFAMVTLTYCKKADKPSTESSVGYKLLIKSGDNQKDTIGSTLKDPIIITATKDGQKLTEYYVKFENTDYNYARTLNVYGGDSAPYDWKLGGTVGKQLLKVFLYDKDRIKRDSGYVSATGLATAAGWHSACTTPFARPAVFSQAPNGRIFQALTEPGYPYYSDDNGVTWKPLMTFHPSFTILSIITASDKELFISTAESGVFYSSDAGQTWEARNPDIPISQIRGKLSYSDSGVLFLSALEGIHRSTNKGHTWENVQGISFYSSFHSLSSQSNGDLYVLSGDNMHVSKDNGKTWQYIYTLSFSYKLKSLFIDDKDEMYLSINNSNSSSTEIIKSINNADSWTNVYTVPPASGTGTELGVVKQVNGSYYFFTNSKGILKTADFTVFNFVGSIYTSDSPVFLVTRDNFILSYNNTRGLCYYKP